ncbi:MAG: DUF4397 domain-containing protein [Chitinophagaceae bacterium]
MSLFNRYKSITAVALTAAVMAVACSKDADTATAATNSNLSDQAVLKVYNAALNTSRNFVYIDNNPLSYTLLAYGASFPSLYGVTVPSGSRTVLVKDTLPTSTQTQITFTNNFEAGKHYTLFTYDTVNAVKYKMVTDAIEIPADTTARLRFANLIFSGSAAAAPNVDIFSVRRNANIFSNIAPGAVTDFIPHPSAPAIDTFYVRIAGTSTTLLQANSYSPTKKRSYTLIFRGRLAEATTTATLFRTLTSMVTY